MNRSIIIDEMKETDWQEVRGIFEAGVRTGNATFEVKVPSWKEWDEKYLNVCRLVAKEGASVVGWAALLPASTKNAFSGVAELSIYIDPEHSGKGIGSMLLKELIKGSESSGFWTLQAGIFPENQASIHLHKKAGFRIIGTRERVGKLHGVFRDVVMMEKRSDAVGLDDEL